MSAAGLSGWLWVWFRRTPGVWIVPAVGVVVAADLFWFAYGRNVQCDPGLYYPRIPALEQLAGAAPGRVVGHYCLPPQLAQTHSLRDIRGYDAVDPARLMELMAIAADPRSVRVPYALTQLFAPKMDFEPPDGIRLPPVLDMLGVRHVIFRGSPPAGIGPAFQSGDYWVLENRAALPRAFVSRKVETITSDRERLDKLASSQFDPREVAYVESPVSLPDVCSGTAEIKSETPTRVTVAVHMETPGLVVLADLWDKGWRAYLGGRLVPILRANHAVRGVVVPEGDSMLEFRYEPSSLTLGLWLSGTAAAALLSWFRFIHWRQRQRVPPDALGKEADGPECC